MPLNLQAKLVQNPFDLAALEKKPTRDGFGKALVEAGERNMRGSNVAVVVLSQRGVRGIIL